MDYQAILKALPTFSSKQLQEIGKRVAALLATSGVGNGQADLPLDEDEDYLAAGIIDELRSRGLGASLPPMTILRRSYRFGEVSKRMRTMLEENIKDMTRAEKRALGTRCASALARSIEKWAAVSTDTMFRHMERIPEALEQSFPGYLKAGLLGLIIRTKSRRR